MIYKKLNIRTRYEGFTNTIENNFFTEVDHPEAGPVKYLTSPVKFNQYPAQIQGASPEIGQHTEEMLIELGYDWDEIERLKDIGAII